MDKKELLTKLDALQEDKGDVAAMRQFVVLGIFILIGVIVFANVDAAAPTSGLDGNASATLANLRTTWYNAVDLLIIVFVVIAAVVILAYVGRIGAAGQ